MGRTSAGLPHFISDNPFWGGIQIVGNGISDYPGNTHPHSGRDLFQRPFVLAADAKSDALNAFAANRGMCSNRAFWHYFDAD